MENFFDFYFMLEFALCLIAFSLLLWPECANIIMAVNLFFADKMFRANSAVATLIRIRIVCSIGKFGLAFNDFEKFYFKTIAVNLIFPDSIAIMLVSIASLKVIFRSA